MTDLTVTSVEKLAEELRRENHRCSGWGCAIAEHLHPYREQAQRLIDSGVVRLAADVKAQVWDEPVDVDKLARALCKADGKVYWTTDVPTRYQLQAQALAYREQP